MSTQGEGLGRTDVLSAYGEVKRKDKWVIPWFEGDNGLHTPEWWVKRTLDYGRNATRLGVDGLIGIHWRTLAHAPEFASLATYPWLNVSRAASIASSDIYTDIAMHEFWPHLIDGHLDGQPFGWSTIWMMPLPLHWWERAITPGMNPGQLWATTRCSSRIRTAAAQWSGSGP